MKNHFIKSIILLLAPLLLTQTILATQAFAETHIIKMLNRDKENKKNKHRNIFKPLVLKIKPGDTVKFVAVDKGHNTESIEDMIPEGAEPWSSEYNEDFELKFDKVGVYGYQCTPHYAMGMVGLIVVEGEGLKASIESAKKVKQFSKAKKVFKKLFEELENPAP